MELILQQLEELPTLPAVAVRVLQLTGSEDSSAAEVTQLISSDPALTSKILALVHRADLGVRGTVNTIDRAVVLLGFEAVRSAVLAVSVFQTFAAPADKQSAHFSREEFWRHSVAVACCAELLTQQMRGPAGAEAGSGAGTVAARRGSGTLEGSEAFICGLLHDIGKVALDAVLPKSFDRVVEAVDLLRGNIADVEHSVIGLDHMVVGKRLAERWQFPTSIRDCIWLHGQHPQALPANVKNARLINLITLADMLVREQHLGYSGNYSFPIARSALIAAVGATEQQVSAVQEQLVARIEQRAVALGLGQASSGELYQQALAQANKELGRLSGQLAAKNRKLSIRAKFFDALSEFQGELRPDAPPQAVIQAIGQTAAGVLGVECAAAFSLLPGQAYAEVLLVDSTGDVFESSFVDCPNRPSRPAGGLGPVLAAGEDMEWLVSAISPRLAHDQRYWICLESDGQCIGGVVWGGPRGEAQRLSTQVNELNAIACGWSLALRTAQIREESRTLAEQLAEANRQLQAAQSEILRSKTMGSVGEMAAGAAHEMNNPLAVISGRSQLLARELSDPKHKHAANLVYEQAQRLSQIISDLMAFAKPVPPTVRSSDVAELIDRALYEAKQHAEPADRKIELTAEDVPQVLVDSQQVTAAVTEVIQNAIQATDAACGHISVHTAYDPTSQRVVLSIADDGCGMDDETIRRAFDPFFSSKRAGRRRGLGLAKALRWVEASGGSIRLDSRPGHGTRVLVLLPADPASGSSGGGQATASGHQPATGAGRRA